MWRVRWRGLASRAAQASERSCTALDRRSGDCKTFGPVSLSVVTVGAVTRGDSVAEQGEACSSVHLARDCGATLLVIRKVGVGDEPAGRMSGVGPTSPQQRPHRVPE